jgi:hypothetical protein
MGSSALRAERESLLMGKVCNLCRMLETGISAVLMVKSDFGSSLIRITLDTFMMMVIDDNYNPVSGISSWREYIWVITWIYY